jgi:hypothetical protein
MSQRAAGERWRFLLFQSGSTREFLVFTLCSGHQKMLDRSGHSRRIGL